MEKSFLALSGLISALGVVLTLGAQSEGATNSVKPLAIEKIHFLIHPLLYRAPYRAREGDDPQAGTRYQRYVDYEKKVSQRWFDAIANMGPTEALVVGAGSCPKDLQDHVEKHLGPRGLVIVEDLINHPEQWNQLSPEAKAGLGQDFMAMYWRYGFAWTSDPLGQSVIARGWAERVKQMFKERNLTFDPKTVKAEGWGESFEGCVANYGRYLSTYLSLTNPIEDDFGMTVPDAPFLLTAKFVERVPLERGVRLYLWKAEDGLLIGFFQKSQAAIGEPSLFAQFPLAGLKLEVRSRMDRPMWPENLPAQKGSAADAMDRLLKKKQMPSWELKRQKEASTIVELNGQLKVPIPSTLIFDASYIFARDTTLADFRAALVNAKLVEEKGTHD